MSVQSSESGLAPEGSSPKVELSVVPPLEETLTSSIDGNPMIKVDAMSDESQNALVEWNKEYLKRAQDKETINNLLDDAFKQELLKYKEVEKDGKTDTTVVGTVDGAKGFYWSAVSKIEQLKAQDKEAAKARVEKAREKTEVAVAPVETRMPNTAETHEVAIAEKRSRSAAQGAETRRANKQAAEESERTAAEEQARDAARIKSPDQAHEAAYAMKETMDTRHELLTQLEQKKVAAERLKEAVGIELSLEPNPRIDALEQTANNEGDVAIRKYAEALNMAVDKALDTESDGVVKETLRGDELNIIEDLRTALGADITPDCIDKDRKSLTQYFKSNLTSDSAEAIILAERYDRKTGRLVEVSIVNGEGLLKLKKGEAQPTKKLRDAISEAQTHESYLTPNEHASMDLKLDGSRDHAIAGNVMYRRGATGYEAEGIQKTKKVKRRQPWWTGLFSGFGN